MDELNATCATLYGLWLLANLLIYFAFVRRPSN